MRRSSRSEPAAPSAETERRLQRLVDSLAARRGVPHVVLAVERGDGTLRWTGTAGEARPGGAPMGPDTPFFIASVTKLYIATLILQLLEDEAVSLDAPMTTYLEYDRVAGIHRLDGTDHTRDITLRHLLSHTSGLPDYLEDAPKGSRSLLDEVLAGADRSWGTDGVIAITRDRLTPHFPPQDLTRSRVRARYSDTNFQLLITVVEAVTDQSFAERLDARILRPLGLRRTWLPGRSEPREVVPEPAAMWHKDQALDIPRATVAFNDLMGPADDMLAFVAALLRGEPFRDPTTVEVLQERWNRVLYPLRYGLGMMRFDVGRLMAPGRRPVTLVGHSGASGSWAFHCPELDVTMAGTINQWAARAVPFRFMPRVLRAVAG